MRIIHAKLFPVDRPPIEDGYVEFSQGRITALGPMPEERKTDEALDAGGAWLFPGFVDAHCHIGMWEDSLGFEGDDGNESTDPSTPQLRGIDAVNPLDTCFAEALAAGITTVVTGPGSANPIGGQLCGMKTYGRRVDEMLIRAPLAMKMALGENPKTVYHDKERTPMTRMGTAAVIREQLARALRYEQEKRRAAQDKDAAEPDYDAKCEALLPVIRGEIPVHFHAHRLDDMATARRIAQEFHLRYVIVHGTQGHLAPDILAADGAPVLCGPLLCERSKPELSSLTPRNPAVLQQAGIKIAIVSDYPALPVQYLPIYAGLAVREGLPHTEALRAITLTPAEICGIEDRVGSITPGKDADLVLFDGDPLSLAAKPLGIIAGGKVITWKRPERKE